MSAFNCFEGQSLSQQICVFKVMSLLKLIGRKRGEPRDVISVIGKVAEA